MVVLALLLPLGLLKLEALIDREAADASYATATANIDSISLPVASDSSSPLLVGSDHQRALARRGRIVLAALYGIQVFYSFFIM